MRWTGLIDTYKEWLPVTDKTPMLTLQEGNTPLVHMTRLSEQWGIDLYVKVEGANPTGSFKDRGMVMAVAKAKEEGKKILICASTGNTSASAAAYGARAGMRTIVVIPEGRIALGKLPVGNAGNISAAWKGFKEYADKKGTELPKLLGVQADGAAPIVYDRVFENPETVATAIRIGNPASWDLANNALAESEGTILAVTDEEILEAYRLIASAEGIFAEPGSCASIAGVKKQVENGMLEKGSTVVAVLTGNGLKAQ